MKQLQLTTLILLLITAMIFADATHNHEEHKHMKNSNEEVQMKCPVMGGAINKEIYTEYNGEKVYFCCEMCIGTFNKNPQGYVKGEQSGSVFDETDDFDDID